VLVPAGTPNGKTLHREIVGIIAQPELKERLTVLGHETVATGGICSKVIRAGNIRLQ
jgi:hypothetical protein